MWPHLTMQRHYCVGPGPLHSRNVAICPQLSLSVWWGVSGKHNPRQIEVGAQRPADLSCEALCFADISCTTLRSIACGLSKLSVVGKFLRVLQQTMRWAGEYVCPAGGVF